tara:strand:+ start:261165 stop:262490 length:1326 start_codon:yes stop_codon:yes gene_type:complete
MPPGVPFIVGNEAAERFSYYGMRTILVVFMTKYLMTASGADDHMTPEEAKTWYHTWSTAVYFTPIFGALIADWFLGKYKTIITLSIVYCLGHIALAMDETRTGLAVGLTLIAIGSGGIKPCVSAHVGDQFGPKNKDLISKVFSWFYFSINLGSVVSTILTPWLLDAYGPSVAFGVPGALMIIATIVFWMGRNSFIHIPAGGKEFIKQSFSGEGLQAILKLLIIYAFVAFFWALYDQTGSAWVLQAQQMDRMFMGYEILPSQLQAVNPFLILVFIPLFYGYLYPAIDKHVFKLNPLRKIGIGLFVTGFAFVVTSYTEMLIEAGQTPSFWWQILGYIIITAGEVMVSITALEFSYTQAPHTMKSIIMAIFLCSVSMGNAFTAAVNFFIQNEDGSVALQGSSYYWFFTVVMFVVAILYVFVSRFYQEKSYIHGESVLAEEGSPS